MSLDVAPIGDEHGDQRAQMQQHVEKFRDVARALHVQQVPGDRQMA